MKHIVPTHPRKGAALPPGRGTGRPQRRLDLRRLPRFLPAPQPLDRKFPAPRLRVHAAEISLGRSRREGKGTRQIQGAGFFRSEVRQKNSIFI